MNLPAYGGRNGRKVTEGTGERLASSGFAAQKERPAYNRGTGKWRSAGSQSEGEIVVPIAGTT